MMKKEFLMISLNDLIDEMLLAMREYIVTFDIYDSFKFSPTEDDIDKIQKRYRALISKLIISKEKSDMLALDIASLTCSSDASMSSEDTLFFSKRLDAYSEWLCALNRFMENNDAIFKKSASDINLASIINLTKVFFNETEILKNYVKNF